MNPRVGVSIVSGGSRGLGLAVVEHLLRRGDSVATFSRDGSDQLDRMVDDHPSRLVAMRVDATDTAAVVGFVAMVVERFGRIDHVVANAAVATEGVLATTPDDVIARLLAVNVQGPIVLVRECVRQWLVQRGGDDGPNPSVVLVSSVVARRGSPGLAMYAATKGAIESFGRCLARELGSRGIRVNTVSPGFLDTDLSATLSASDRARIVRRTPLGRLGVPADVVGAIDYLTSDRAGFITGQTITIDGGGAF
ncbi:MAG: SDR family NAD(P)-dependent oxidoreductase [Planctomycetaceae bacterium]